MEIEPQASFAERVLIWFDQYGRKHLPWQQERTPYRVWVSEIMLQQTQVSTVIPYFERFMRSFPDIHHLAAAAEDEVLHHWSGLGYYARARNLHKAAKQVCAQYGGEMPCDVEALQALSGIGRSTAGAIMSLACGQRQPILDGNVKRVLCRYHAIAGWSGSSAVSKQLWELAEQHTPQQRFADYTQAMMDLGATLCRRGKPACTQCPLGDHCQAYQQDAVASYPAPKPRKTLPIRQTCFLLIANAQQQYLLLRRPPTGLWGGLWGFPEYADAEQAAQYCRQQLGLEVSLLEKWPVFRHTFTHFHLDIQPLLLRLDSASQIKDEAGQALWYNQQQPESLGLAAPVARLLEQLSSHEND